MRNQGTRKKIAGGGDVVTSLIPEIGEAKKRSMRGDEGRGKQREQGSCFAGAEIGIACQA